MNSIIRDRIELAKGDITTIETDAIVNAANNSLLGGGGVDGAIHRKGGENILKECIKIREKQGGCPTGEAVITTAGDLPAKNVIHTVGPIWEDGASGEAELLNNAYNNSLELANKFNLATVTFPNISTGVYGYPKEKAATIAINAVKMFLEIHSRPEKVIFVCFDDENYEIYRSIIG